MMRNLVIFSMCGVILLTLGCQAEKDLEQCRLTQQSLESSLRECKQERKDYEGKTTEILDIMLNQSREELKKCNTHWKGKLEESQQAITQTKDTFEKKITTIQQELEAANKKKQLLQEELANAIEALATATAQKNELGEKIKELRDHSVDSTDNAEE